jgi:signal transduction histidine kinase/DNA-binding response OmpR family regulator
MEENNYKKLLDDTDHIIFVSDMNTLEILYGNKNVLNYGHKNGILPEGLTCYEYFMGLDKPCEFCPVAQLEKNHEDLVLELDDGKNIFRSKAIRTEWEGRDAFVVYRTDITESKKYHGLMSALSKDYFAVYHLNLDKDEYIILSKGNDINDKIFQGKSTIRCCSDTLKKFANAYICEEDRDKFLAMTDLQYMKQRLMNEESYVIRYRAKIKDNMEYLESRFVRSKIDEEGMYAVSGIRNVDSEVRKELEYQKNLADAYNKEIETRQAMKEAFDAAISANKAKTDFLSRMSHDMRTPMNAIIGMTAIAGAHLDDKERVKDSLGKISSSSRHLLGIINDILDMSKIESGSLHINEENFNLSELLKNFLDIMRPQVLEKNHELKVHIHDIKHEDVIGDYLRIQQAFINIMSNAIKYTPNGGVITISAYEKPTHKTRTACYEFVFEDNGVGMSPEFLEKIFEPFERAEDLRTSKIQGTGLGMAITKNFINMMGGQIKVQSELGKGSKFTITFFLKLQEELYVDTDALYGLPVLIVDDDEISCENTSNILNEIGMDSEWVLRGREAVERVKIHHFNDDDYFAVIIDWKMPDMNGIETTKAIREIVGNDVPIIIISAYDWTDIEQEARDAGANAFITKPAFKSNLTRLFLGLVQDSDGDAGHVSDVKEYDLKDKRVLLVEDNDLNREITVEILGSTGIEICEAENGRQAVEIYKVKPEYYFDLILMDIQMPVMNGYDATIAIRSLGRKDSKSIPIIAMTANAFAEDVSEALNAGMNEHIAKPIDIKKLIECVKKWAER